MCLCHGLCSLGDHDVTGVSLAVQAADVVCVTCAGAGDPRLSSFRFRKVSALQTCASQTLHLDQAGDLLL